MVSIPEKELNVSQKLQICGYITVKDGYIVIFFSYTITSVLKTTRFQLKKFNTSCNSFKEHYEQYRINLPKLCLHDQGQVAQSICLDLLCSETLDSSSLTKLLLLRDFCLEILHKNITRNEDTLRKSSFSVLGTIHHYDLSVSTSHTFLKASSIFVEQNVMSMDT